MLVQRQTVVLGRILRFSGLTLLPSPPIIQGVPFDVSASVFCFVSALKPGAEPLRKDGMVSQEAQAWSCAETRTATKEFRRSLTFK
jgi:hypothetical protein